jgi:hypothetical protein
MASRRVCVEATSRDGEYSLVVINEASHWSCTVIAAALPGCTRAFSTPHSSPVGKVLDGITAARMSVSTEPV